MTTDRDACLRILDANVNRATEGLRVLEEYARFVLEDGLLCAQCKDLRHALRQAVARLPAPHLSLFRDTPGDVGTARTTAAERQRRDAAEVAAAAAMRLGEALRVLEEYGKTVSADFAGQVKSLRYEAYTVGARMVRRLQGARRMAGVRLCVLITASACRGDWLETAETALAAGAGAVQLREKELSDGELYDRACRLRSACVRHQALLIINDRPDIAKACHADGVHLGQDDLPVAAARRILGPEAIIGVSTHTVQQAREALTAGPDYIAVGPMFPSTTKPQPLIAGPHTLQQVRPLTSLPIVAIGGITPDNAAVLRGADVLAVCDAVVGAAEVHRATTRLLQARPQ